MLGEELWALRMGMRCQKSGFSALTPAHVGYITLVVWGQRHPSGEKQSSNLHITYLNFDMRLRVFSVGFGGFLGAKTRVFCVAVCIWLGMMA